MITLGLSYMPGPVVLILDFFYFRLALLGHMGISIKFRHREPLTPKKIQSSRITNPRRKFLATFHFLKYQVKDKSLDCCLDNTVWIGTRRRVK